MAKVTVLQMPLFRRAYKKLHPKEKFFVDEAIREIIKNPKSGEVKRGDLSSVYVFKFKIHKQERLLAYEWNDEKRVLLALGTHENFYRDLKKSISF